MSNVAFKLVNDEVNGGKFLVRNDKPITVSNTAEQEFGNFKVVADAINSFANKYALSNSERYVLAQHIVNALESVTEDNQVCFDADSFIDVALGE